MTVTKPATITLSDLPKAARDLVNLAKDHGWKVTGAANMDSGGNPFVDLRLQRLAPEWEIRVTWHTRATGGKSFRLFSNIWRHVPLQGQGFYWQDAPSLKAVRQVILDNPVEPTTLVSGAVDVNGEVAQ